MSNDSGPWIEFGAGWAKIHFRRQVTEKDRANLAAAIAPAQPSGEIAAAWQTLEGYGFAPEASGWPSQDLSGLLPEAIDSAIACLIRQREDLLTEVMALRGPTRRLMDALEAAESALAGCYQVTDYPADGTTGQDHALALVRAALTEAKP